MMNKIKKFYGTNRAQKIVISIFAVILMFGGVTLATLYTPASTSKTDVSITLTFEDIKEKIHEDVKVILNADIEITKDETSVEKVSMAINKPTILSIPLEVGTYSIKMTSSPIESDGSMYKIPSKIANIVISDEDVKNGETVNVEIMLERIAVEDMTKEQLEVAIERINNEAPDENKELVESLNKRQETPVSHEASVNDVQQESQVKEEIPKIEDTPKAETKPNNDDSGSISSSGSSGGNTGNKHEHNWVPYMVDIPEKGHNESTSPEYQRVDLVSFGDPEDPDAYRIYVGDGHVSDEDYRTQVEAWFEKHPLSHYSSVGHYLETKPGTSKWVVDEPAHQEQDGFKCSCGSYKNR